MRGFNRITEGLVKALGYISGHVRSPNATGKQIKPKWQYTADTAAVHRVRGPNGMIVERSVPVIRASRIDYSRYTGADLRAINARGGGPKEKARAAKRVAGMQRPASDLPLAAE